MKIAFLCMVVACMAQQAPPTARKPPAAPTDAGAAVDSLGNSLQDLNAIRDANLGRVQKDGGCPPETAARLADLRIRLRQSEAELSGDALAKDTGVPVDATSIAADWFKRAPQNETEPAAARESRLLADVLPGAPPAIAGAKPQQTAQQKKALEDEIARLKTEVARLSGTCVAVKK
jgi:hypothetical protein